MRVDVERRAGAAGDQHDGDPNRRLWSRGRVSPVATLRLAAYRLSRGRGVALAAGLGMLVAVVLLCTVPLFIALTSNLQLEHTLNTSLPQERNLWLSTLNSQIAPAQRATQDPLARALGRRFAASFTEPAPTYSVTANPVLLLRETGQDYSRITGGPQLRFEAWDYASAAAHMRFVAGGPPQPAATGAPQMVITQEMAQDEHLAVGDSITASQLALRDQTATFSIAGIWTPRDPNDAYWNGFTFTADGTDTTPAIYPVLVPLDTFFAQLSTFSGLGMSQNWFFYTRPQAITTANLGAITGDIAALRTQTGATLRRQPGVYAATVATRLDTSLGALRQQQALLALPLYVIVAQVVGLALLFVAAMAGLLIESQGSELATLKSRGTSASQLLGSFTLQGALLALIAAVVGPVLAALLALGLVQWLLPAAVVRQAGVSAAYLARIARPSDVIISAVAGARLGIAAVAVAVWQAARVDVVSFRRDPQ
ncbi:MAG: hypothetical protein ACHQ4H_17380, partial [Ktedonobacterales bacterium]